MRIRVHGRIQALPCGLGQPPRVQMPVPGGGIGNLQRQMRGQGRMSHV